MGHQPGQERILAVKMTREGIRRRASQTCLSQYDPGVYADHDTWQQLKNRSPVGVQWDTERDTNPNPLPWHTIQNGLTGTATHSYATIGS